MRPVAAVLGAAARLGFWALLAPAGLSACTIKTTGDDAGSPAVVTTSESVNYQCSAIGTALCEALPMCAIASSGLSDCMASYVATCCTSATCDETSLSSDAVLQACIAEYQAPNLDCNALATNVVPDACVGVPQLP